jgi:hypothetical protein
MNLFPDDVLGSEGLRLEKISDDHYRAVPAPSRGLPLVPNMLQFRCENAAHTPVRIDVTFPVPEPRGKFDEYPHSATPDFRTFLPLEWEKPCNGVENTLWIPATPWNTFRVGMQCALPLEALEEKIRIWKHHPDVEVEELGRSIQDRPIPLIRVKGREQDVRWRHVIVNQHPGEGNARWRLTAMLDRLLSDDPECAALRARSEVVFIPLLCPDGPANGWRRVNADGIDMNRCFRMEGPDAAEQTHEAFLFQYFLEQAPPHTLWCMHTWPGMTEPVLDGCGPEFNRTCGTVQDLQELFVRHGDGLLKPLRVREEPGGAETWNGGPRRRLGITTFLIEGGGEPAEPEPHEQTGLALLRILGDFWS